ncbi:MAG: NADH-quinone oxidoreductase subunit, partial [Betaproteobacteria bacterium]|nr:NADH-quinone oxidoreductase subunit [Betaproteobacteria bacterium]
PHDGLGSNLIVQIKQNRVMRVLPRENEAVNECWLSDRDRFSYEGLNSEQRLARPMMKRPGDAANPADGATNPSAVWEPVEWQVALNFIATRLKEIREAHGADAIGALASPHQTLEELYLLQKLVRGLGTGNVDFRLRQADFSGDGRLEGAPWLGMSIADIPSLEQVLVIGSTLRKEHPLLAHRLRQGTKKGLALSLVNPVDDELLMRVANKVIVAPAAMADALAQVVKAAAGAKNTAVPESVRDAVDGVEVTEAAKRLAEGFASGAKSAIFLGNLAQHHPAAATLHALAQALADLTGAQLGFLGEAANSVGGHIAGAVPYGAPSGQKAGKNAAEMVREPLKAYMLLGVEADLDTHDPARTIKALKQAELVVAMGSFEHPAAFEYAHVMLPISPFTETAGTFVSTEGRVQSFTGCVQPLGETRPAWKVLRVLGNLLELPGFDQDSADAVKREALGAGEVSAGLGNRVSSPSLQPLAPAAARGLQRIGEVPIYSSDPLVRRSMPLQKTRDAEAPVAWVSPALYSQLGLVAGDFLRVRQENGEATVAVAVDEHLPDGCIRLAAARPETAGLGAMMGAVSAERVAGQQKVAV